ncbi:MAG: hypothetical protein WCS86_01520 [Candidatus Paceibacterota bacterium]
MDNKFEFWRGGRKTKLEVKNYLKDNSENIGQDDKFGIIDKDWSTNKFIKKEKFEIEDLKQVDDITTTLFDKLGKMDKLVIQGKIKINDLGDKLKHSQENMELFLKIAKEISSECDILISLIKSTQYYSKTLLIIFGKILSLQEEGENEKLSSIISKKKFLLDYSDTEFKIKKLEELSQSMKSLITSREKK